ncbi:MAG: helix-turn-helix domain-containing protein [Faecalibacterium prausnitzii]|nr:helix-turn-helix domain-containing protein [Faecalibacterium prausnitzii]
MATLYDRIKSRRTELGLTVEELAHKMGYKDKSSISKIENGKADIPQSKIAAFADALETTPAYLMGWEEQPTPAPSPIPPGFAVPGDKTPLPAGATAMNPHQVAPLLGTVRAGLPMYAEENIVDYIPIRQTDGASYFWLTVRGDSMNAAGMEDGDQILVRTQPEAENGQLAVVMVNGNEATVKYFRREGDLVILTPKSFNPVHQPQIYDLKRVPVQIAGLVVECRKVFR